VDINDDNLPIALHHGSLDVGQRRKVEAAMAANRLRAVVATSTLDLGIDWGDVDLVVHVGAPKGASRLRSASAAPTTAWTSRRRRSWCRPTASR
jgi:Lhr-like helicase